MEHGRCRNRKAMAHLELNLERYVKSNKKRPQKYMNSKKKGKCVLAAECD